MKASWMKRKGTLLAVCIGIGLCGLGTRAEAQLDFHVTLNTSAIAGGMYYVEFSLSDGQVANGLSSDGNNTAVINTFDLGGGAAGAILPPTLGNASGDIAGGFSLTDSDPNGTADIAQGFTAGNSLSFNVHLTTNVDTGPTPDEFLFKILDSTATTIATNDPNGNNGFLDISITSSTLTINNVAAYSSSNPLITNTVTPIASNNVPEPGAVALLFGSVCSVSAFALRRRRCR